METEPLRLIAGSGRSGTTWVLDALAKANKVRPLFEPLHPTNSKIGRSLSYTYLTGEADCKELRAFLLAVTNNTFRSLWSSYRIVPHSLMPSYRHLYSLAALKTLLRKWLLLARAVREYREQERWSPVLMKCIRANLMLDWIRANFPARIVLLMRHPCAVVESQLRFSETWDPYPVLARYTANAALTNGPLHDRSSILARKLSRAEALAAIWCIENFVPASQAAANDYQVIFYEELLERPDQEWLRLAEGLSLNIVPAAGLRQIPSQQAAVRLLKRELVDKSYPYSYANWREQLSTEDLRQIAAVLEAFGIDFYSVSEARPDVDLFRRNFLMT